MPARPFGLESLRVRIALWLPLALSVWLLVAGLVACRNTPTPPRATPTPTRAGFSLGGMAFIRDSNVWLADANGSNPRQLTADGNAGRPYGFLRWAPDGSQLAFVNYDLSSRQGRLLLAQTDGSIILIAEDAATLAPPAWSPAGDQIAYVADRKQKTADGRAIRVVRTVDLARRQMRDVGNLGFEEGCDGPLFDPASQAYVREMGSGSYEPVGRRPTLLWTDHGDFVLDVSCRLAGLGWMSGKDGRTVVLGDSWTSAVLSPDGQRLAAIQEANASTSSGRTLVIAGADGTGAVTVDTGDNPLMPVWSPDGATVYYTTRDEERRLELSASDAQAAGLGNTPAAFSVYRSRIRRIRLDGSRPETALDAVAHGLANLTFSRSGSRLVYTLVANSIELYDAIRAGKRGDELKATFPAARLESISIAGPADGFVLFEKAGQGLFAGPSAVPIAKVVPNTPTAPVAQPTMETPAAATETATPEAAESPEPSETATQPLVVVSRTPTRPAPTPTAAPIISAWRGEYFDNRDLVGAPALVRNDNAVEFDWGTGSPAPGIPADNFSARWTRSLPFGAGNYRFQVRADDGVRLFVDNVAIVDEWHNAQATYTAYFNLSGGNHLVRVEYFDAGGGGYVHVGWAAFDEFPAWRGEYFANRNLEGAPFMLRNDSNIDFNWKGGSPQAGLPTDDFSVRWGRSVKFDAGRYRFSVRADDGVRLYVDGERLINQWREGNDRVFEAEADLSAGRHDIRLDYFERTVNARVTLSWERLAAPATPSQTPVKKTPTRTATPRPEPTKTASPTATQGEVPTPETVEPPPTFTAEPTTGTPVPPAEVPSTEEAEATAPAGT